jgi:L-2-aminoadipate reductase
VLGDTDTHLSRHPKVRENVTLVRREKSEGPTLVSYFVPLEDASVDSDGSGETSPPFGCFD